MSGLASRERYFAWGADLRPWPGELEYLAGASQNVTPIIKPRPYDTRVKSVTDNTYSYARARR